MPQVIQSAKGVTVVLSAIDKTRDPAVADHTSSLSMARLCCSAITQKCVAARTSLTMPLRLRHT